MYNMTFIPKHFSPCVSMAEWSKGIRLINSKIESLEVSLVVSTVPSKKVEDEGLPLCQE